MKWSRYFSGLFWLSAFFVTVAALFIFWPSKRFDGYDMIHMVQSDDPFGTAVADDPPRWHDYVPDAILELFRSARQDSWYERMYLPDNQQEELQRIFEEFDLSRDGSEAEGIPFIGSFGEFLISMDGRPYLLTMYYSGPVPGGTYDLKQFSLYPLELVPQGDFVAAGEGIEREFECPVLYDRLERFLQDLPDTSPGRHKYDTMRQAMEQMMNRARAEGEKTGDGR